VSETIQPRTPEYTPEIVRWAILEGMKMDDDSPTSSFSCPRHGIFCRSSLVAVSPSPCLQSPFHHVEAEQRRDVVGLDHVFGIPKAQIEQWLVATR
jgi:hypothetical protein